MIDERAVSERLAQVVKRALEEDGLQVYGQVEVEVWHRWDRHHASVTIRAEVAPRC